MSASNDDSLLKFLFRAGPVRGEIVRLGASWRQIAARHGFAAPVTRLLGEATAAAALLSTTLKFNGSLILQIHGDGPVRLLVVECQPDLALRATAKLRDDQPIDPDAGLRGLVNANGGGRCAITLDPRDRRAGQQPYQGIVPLQGDSIAAALQAYLRQSQQLDTRLWLAADGSLASGLLLQKLPRDGGLAAQRAECAGRDREGEGEDGDLWDRALALAGTVTDAELLAVPPQELAQRLFWQEATERFEPLSPRFACSCSRARIGRMLLALGQSEADAILVEQGRISVTCDFCNSGYDFDAVDTRQLFATGSTERASATPH
jgi:molecular chaperone Hsp33